MEGYYIKIVYFCGDELYLLFRFMVPNFSIRKKNIKEEDTLE